MPAIAPDEAVDTDDKPYPQPKDWFYGLRRRYVRHVSFGEHAAMTTSGGGDEPMDVDVISLFFRRVS